MDVIHTASRRICLPGIMFLFCSRDWCKGTAKTP